MFYELSSKDINDYMPKGKRTKNRSMKRIVNVQHDRIFQR